MCAHALKFIEVVRVRPYPMTILVAYEYDPRRYRLILGIGQRALSSLSRLETPGYPVFRFVRMACVSVNILTYIEDVSYILITNKSR